MSAVEATISLMQAMPKQEQLKIYEYAREVADSFSGMDVFRPLTLEDVLTDLAISRKETESGKCSDMEQALNDMGRAHGFL